MVASTAAVAQQLAEISAMQKHVLTQQSKLSAKFAGASKAMGFEQELLTKEALFRPGHTPPGGGAQRRLSSPGEHRECSSSVTCGMHTRGKMCACAGHLDRPVPPGKIVRACTATAQAKCRTPGESMVRVVKPICWGGKAKRYSTVAGWIHTLDKQ